MKHALWVACALLLSSGCKRNPVDRLTNALGGGAVPDISGTYIIYDEELKTGGGLGLIPAGQNQSINLLATDPNRAGRVIRYSWSGGNVSTGTPQHLFAGFMLLITPDFVGFEEAEGKDLSFGAYTELKFWIRGELATDVTVRIEGPDDGAGGIHPVQDDSVVLTSNWQEVTINLPTLAHFNNVKSFITITFQYAQPPRTTTPGGGGTIYIDDIRYEQ